MNAIRTIFSMAALLGPLSLTPEAAAQIPGAETPAPAPPSTATSPFAPPPNGLPPGYVAPPPSIPPQLVALPRTLPYRENQPAPLGFRMETRANSGLIIAGSTMLASMWALSAVTGGIVVSDGGRDSSGYSPLMIPLVGPFITLGTGADVDLSTENDRPAGVLILLSGLTQATGLALIIGGLAADQKYWVRNDIPRSAFLRPPEVIVGPGGGALRFRF